MTYNGYANQDAFHEAMRARWNAMSAHDIARTGSGHGPCDHANGYCNPGPHIPVTCDASCPCLDGLTKP